MSVGLSADLVNAWLNTLRNNPFTVPGTFVQLHTTTGDPGADGTSNPFTVTTRMQAVFSASVEEALALTGVPPTWQITAAGALGYYSVWSALTGGMFLWSNALTVPENVADGDTWAMNTCNLVYPTSGLAA